MNDYDVTLRLELEAAREPIEDLAIRVLEVVERHGFVPRRSHHQPASQAAPTSAS